MGAVSPDEENRTPILMGGLWSAVIVVPGFSLWFNVASVLLAAPSACLMHGISAPAVPLWESAPTRMALLEVCACRAIATRALPGWHPREALARLKPFGIPLA